MDRLDDRAGPATSWRPLWQVVVALAVLDLAVRFIHHSLFQGTLLSLRYYPADAIVVNAIGVAGHRYTRTRQITTQYRWLFERTGPPRPTFEILRWLQARSSAEHRGP